MSNHDRGAPLPSLGTSRNVAHLSSGMDDGPADAPSQGREPALESMLPALELCNKVNLPHCLFSSAKYLSGPKVHLWTPEGVHVRSTRCWGFHAY